MFFNIFHKAGLLRREGWNPSIFVCVRKYFFTLKGLYHWVQNYRLMGFFSQHFKCFSPLFSCLHGFWGELRYNSYLCSYFYRIIFQILSLTFCIFIMIYLCVGGCCWFVLGFLHLSCVEFSELPGFVIWCLTLIWGNSESFFFLFLFWSLFVLFLSLFLSPAGMPIMHMLQHLWLSRSSRIFCSVCFPVFTLWFAVWEVSTETSSSSEFLSSAIPVC